MVQKFDGENSDEWLVICQGFSLPTLSPECFPYKAYN